MHTVPDTTESPGHFFSGLAPCARAVLASSIDAAAIMVARSILFMTMSFFVLGANPMESCSGHLAKDGSALSMRFSGGGGHVGRERDGTGQRPASICAVLGHSSQVLQTDGTGQPSGLRSS